jgi:large subunit ribosomal protein L15
MKLHNLTAPIPNQKSAKRRGRGEGSGLGQESGRGHKGQKAGSGFSKKIGFEGGQMPLQRRAPKFGFKNPFRVEYQALNLSKISEAIESGKLSNSISLADLVNAGLVRKNTLVKILGFGELTKAVSIEAHKISSTAAEKIQQAGGSFSELTK